MESLGGVFLTLVVGVLVGLPICIFEFWWDKSQIPYGERVSPGSGLRNMGRYVGQV